MEITYFLGSCIMELFCISVWKAFIKQKIDLKDYKLYLFAIILSVSSTFLNFFTSMFLKMIIISLILIIVYNLYIYRNLRYSVISVLITQILFMVSETLFVFFVSLVLKIDMNVISNSCIGVLMINIFITLIAFLIVKTKIPVKIFDESLNVTNSIQNNKLSKYAVFMVLFAVILTNLSYNKLSYEYFLIVSTIIVVIYLLIIYKMTKAENNLQEINKKYYKTQQSFKEYEMMMDKYHLMNHEMKNEFRTVRAMVLSGEKNIDKYIDLVINEKIDDNEKLMKKLYKIPNGFLRAMLYSEFSKMEQYKITNSLYLSKEVKTSKLIELDDSLAFDICNILSIFIDNAIDCVINEENKTIKVNFYMEDKYLIIEIVNDYSGNIDLELISKKRYSTKGNGRGYGLALAKEIVENNQSLINNTILTKKHFTQILKIKM